MSSYIDPRVIGLYKDALGRYHEVVEEVTMVGYKTLADGEHFSPGSINYVTKDGIELNPVGEDTSRFSMVLEDMEIWRVDPTE